MGLYYVRIYSRMKRSSNLDWVQLFALTAACHIRAPRDIFLDDIGPFTFAFTCAIFNF
jgi:hypothetical protein